MESTMKKYLVLYRAPISSREQMAQGTPEQQQAGMDAWMAWAKRAADSIVDLGSPLGDTAQVGGGHVAGHIGGFSILRAASLDDAKKLLDKHPHFMMPGGSIE